MMHGPMYVMTQMPFASQSQHAFTVGTNPLCGVPSSRPSSK